MSDDENYGDDDFDGADDIDVIESDGIDIDDIDDDDDNENNEDYIDEDNTLLDIDDTNIDDTAHNVAQKKEIIVKNKNRKSNPRITKYEKAHIIGIRLSQLEKGAKCMIKNSKNLTANQKVVAEYNNKIIPLIIKRPLFNGRNKTKAELWKFSELTTKKINEAYDDIS